MLCVCFLLKAFFFSYFGFLICLLRNPWRLGQKGLVMDFLRVLFSSLSHFFGAVAEYLANPRSVMAEWEADKSACDWFCTCEHCEYKWSYDHEPFATQCKCARCY